MKFLKSLNLLMFLVMSLIGQKLVQDAQHDYFGTGFSFQLSVGQKPNLSFSNSEK